MENTLSANSMCKINKKNLKCQHTLKRETGISPCKTPTVNIAICNTGLSNGLTEEKVLNAFAPFGTINEVIMIPGKSCCFIIFNEVSCAEKAFMSINGKLNIAQDNKPIYLAFTEIVPKLEKNSLDQEFPPGLILIEDFISEDEEKILLSSIKWSDDSNNLKHRRVEHYGYEFKYDISNVDKKSPLENKIPDECDLAFKKFYDKCKQFKYFKANQLTVNEYKSGQGIPSHIDTHSAFEDPILSLSLCSSINMEFRQKEKHITITLPQRSLLIMSSESRYSWSHGITPRKSDIVRTKNSLTVQERKTRISLTFRQIRMGECDCIYNENCDSHLKKKEIEDNLAAKLESLHVHKVYEEIATHFSNTRHTPWPNVLNFVQSFPLGSILFDVGCGNGKYFGVNYNTFQMGCDYSKNLLAICKQRGYQVFNCDCLNLSLKNECVDGIICIAVIHHLANNMRRLQAIQEIIRVLRIGGKALIYVWAKNQQKFEKSSYLKQDRKNRKSDDKIHDNAQASAVTIENDVSLPVHVNRTQFLHQDVLVPWKRKNDSHDEITNKTSNMFLRYYHVFEENEIEMLCKSLKNTNIINSYYDQGNWCVQLEKIRM